MWIWLATAAVLGAVGYAYWTHQEERRRLDRILREMASVCGGQVDPGSTLYLPSLKFETELAVWSVGGMATDGTPGSGSFTYANAEPRLEMDFSRQWERVPVLEQRLADAGSDRVTASVKDGVVRVHRDGIANSVGEIEEMIDLAEKILGACLIEC